MTMRISNADIDAFAEKAIDLHCHGVGRFDFTEINAIDLDEIESILAERKHHSFLTLYLPKPNFEDFLDLMSRFSQKKKSGNLKHIVGFGLEGPLLASHGGTPEEGVWMPSKKHWQQLAALGKEGLIYVVLSPDARLPETEANGDPNSITWIAETLLQGGVLPTPGHFLKSNPSASAKALKNVFDAVEKWGRGATITDHLFNDMPHTFKHAWRTPEEKAVREQEVQALNLQQWSLGSLDEDLGPVPAEMIRAARKGLVKICINFDGEHVDLAIVKRAVELAGAENILMMTDSIESKRLAGRKLHLQEKSTLLYQDEGVVAAGTQGIVQQVRNMVSIGLTAQQIELITSLVPRSILKNHEEYIHAASSHS